MVITSEEEYAAALERLEQMFGKVEDDRGALELAALVEAIQAWEAKVSLN